MNIDCVPVETRKRLADLPPLPTSLSEVVQALRTGDLSSERCIELIERDPALAARCLRLANSPFYGRPGKIGSVYGAVTMLGLRTVMSLLTAVSLQHAFKPEHCPGFQLDVYWRHAMGVAMTASVLAPRLGLDPSEAFLAGLLHDIGELMLVVLQPDAQEEIRRRVRSGEMAEVVEQEVLAIDHVALGASIAQQWHFPQAIVDAIADHHRFWMHADRPPTTLADLLSLIHGLLTPVEMGLPACEAALLVPDVVWDALRYEPGERAEVLDRLIANLSAIAQT